MMMMAAEINDLHNNNIYKGHTHYVRLDESKIKNGQRFSF